jgi:hypothetical protein
VITLLFGTWVAGEEHPLSLLPPLDMAKCERDSNLMLAGFLGVLAAMLVVAAVFPLLFGSTREQAKPEFGMLAIILFLQFEVAAHTAKATLRALRERQKTA